MILQKLSECYDIMRQEDEENIPEIGYSKVQIEGVIVITKEGEFVQIVHLEEGVSSNVPLQKRRSGKNPPSYFLCDFPSYFFGKKIVKGKLEDCPSYLENAYKLHHAILKDSTNPRAQAILKFLDKQKDKKEKEQIVQEDYELGRLVFRLKDETDYIHDDAEIKALWLKYLPQYMEDEKKPNARGQCLISGKSNQIICRTHNAVPIPGGEANGSSIVSFNNKAFSSYKKEQSNNSPISFEEMFKYTTILKYLIKSKENRCILQNTICVFWTTEGNNSIPTNLIKVNIVGQQDEQDNSELNVDEIEEDSDIDIDLDEEELPPEEDVKKVTKEIMKKIAQGKPSQDIEDLLERHKETQVYLLGLTPNKSRVAVKFFHECSFGNFVKNIQAHYKRLAIEPSFEKPISILNLLWVSIRDGSEYDPLIRDRLLSSVINNTSYPINLFYKCITRYIIENRQIAKAELSEKVLSTETKKLKYKNKIRVAFIKAYLLKEQENKNWEIKRQEEITVGLNKDNLNVGYNLGRLFAVLEITQKKAGNETLSERYFSGACTTPAVMFITLLKLNKAHLTKIEKKEETKGLARYYENLNSEILSHIECLPNSLSQEDQGYFILGYYHQKQDLYTKKEDKNIEGLKDQEVQNTNRVNEEGEEE